MDLRVSIIHCSKKIKAYIHHFKEMIEHTHTNVEILASYNLGGYPPGDNIESLYHRHDVGRLKDRIGGKLKKLLNTAIVLCHLFIATCFGPSLV